MNYRVALAIGVQGALLTCLFAPSRVSCQEHKSKVPEAVRMTEEAVAEHEDFEMNFEISKSEYNEKNRKLSWLLKCKANGTRILDLGNFEVSSIRFRDSDNVVLARVHVRDFAHFELSAEKWLKGENVSGSLKLPKDLDISKVKTVDIVAP